MLFGVDRVVIERFTKFDVNSIQVTLPKLTPVLEQLNVRSSIYGVTLTTLFFLLRFVRIQNSNINVNS